jgi:hypothetical protein
MSQPAGSHNSPCEAGPSKKGRVQGRAFLLQFRAGVGVDFAVQANFFKSRCCPLHDDFSQLSFRESNREREISIADPRDEINTSEKKCLRIPRCMGLLTLTKPTKPAGFCTLTARLHFPSSFPHPEPLPSLSRASPSVYLRCTVKSVSVFVAGNKRGLSNHVWQDNFRQAPLWQDCLRRHFQRRQFCPPAVRHLLRAV